MLAGKTDTSKTATPTLGKGTHAEPKATKGALTKGGSLAAPAGGLGFQDWVIAHPYQSVVILVCFAALICTIIWQINAWQKRRNEAAPAGWVPPPANLSPPEIPVQP